MKRWIHAKEDFVIDWDLSKDPKLSKKMKRYEQMGIEDEEDAYDRAHREGNYEIGWTEGKSDSRLFRFDLDIPGTGWANIIAYEDAITGYIVYQSTVKPNDAPKCQKEFRGDGAKGRAMRWACEYLGIEPSTKVLNASSKVSCSVHPWKVKYEVHWISPEGRDCLLGGSNDINEANDIAIEQAREIFESPWESDERKYKFLDSMYIFDRDPVGYSEDAMLYQAEEEIDNLMSELDSRIKK